MASQGFIHNLISRLMAAPAEAIAFSLYNGEHVRDIPYPEFVNDLLKAANYFASRGIAGKHIAIAAPNSYDWVVAFFAITASGNTGVMLNQDLPKDTLRWYCKKADVTMICGDRETIADMKDAFSDYPLISFDEIHSDDCLPLDRVHVSSAEETIAMIFTSGTTGESKVVEITSDNLAYSLANLDPSYAVKGMERLFTPIPFFHVAGFTTVLEALNQHKTECLGRGIRYMFMDMPVLNPTTINAVPSIVESLLKVFKRAADASARSRFVGSNFSLICVSGAVLKPTVSSYLRSLGLDISVYYGMSEVTGAATWMQLDDGHIGATGKFCEYSQYRFEDGELLLSGPTLMKQYYKDPAETEKVIGNRWIHTGDMGYCDEDGYLYLTGRKKNVIILSNGENVNPEEVEEKLGACEYILECMVYGDGKGICAEIYTENQDAAAAFVREYNAQTPMYRQVYKISYTGTPLEKTGSGKIKRKENVYA